ncbi:DUF4145 domain-containing protein [Streptomyces sp. NPDC059810]|uniref:DUF4145 domain-containing protein n=1 Tax=Streptomyces sp. NPDC059810 TaxID=3346956 RepID=UPI0036583A8E
MATTVCGWCGINAHMAMVTDVTQVPKREGFGYAYMAAFRCSNELCQRLVVGRVFRGTNYTSPKREMAEDLEIQWEPAQVRRPHFPDVPPQIGATASEAHACLSIGAHRGAVALARAVVEATAKFHGITSGALVSKIDRMHEAGLIREITREVAHEIRQGGNEIAHGDLADEPMPAEDAEAIVEFMDAILQEVFQGPARMKDLQRRRQERKERNSEQG